MILAALIMNTQGKPRLTKFYDHLVRSFSEISLSCHLLRSSLVTESVCIYVVLLFDDFLFLPSHRIGWSSLLLAFSQFALHGRSMFAIHVCVIGFSRGVNTECGAAARGFARRVFR